MNRDPPLNQDFWGQKLEKKTSPRDNMFRQLSGWPETKKNGCPKKNASTPRDHQSTVVFSWRLARTLRFKDLAAMEFHQGRLELRHPALGEV